MLTVKPYMHSHLAAANQSRHTHWGSEALQRNDKSRARRNASRLSSHVVALVRVQRRGVRVAHGAEVVAGAVEVRPQPDGPPELGHRGVHQVRALGRRPQRRELLQDQTPVVQGLQSWVRAAGSGPVPGQDLRYMVPSSPPLCQNCFPFISIVVIENVSSQVCTAHLRVVGVPLQRLAVFVGCSQQEVVAGAGVDGLQVPRHVRQRDAPIV